MFTIFVNSKQNSHWISDAYSSFIHNKSLVMLFLNRIFQVFLISIFLTGCPVTFNALLKNESTYQITVIPPFNSELSWIIDSGGVERINWFQECITIQGAAGVQYFAGWPIPDNVVSNNLFSSSLEVIYKNDALFFINNEGQLIQVDEVATCDKA